MTPSDKFKHETNLLSLLFIDENVKAEAKKERWFLRNLIEKFTRVLSTVSV